MHLFCILSVISSFYTFFILIYWFISAKYMIKILFIVLSYHNKPSIFPDIRIKKNLKEKGFLPSIITNSVERKKRLHFIVVIHFPLLVFLTFLQLTLTSIYYYSSNNIKKDYSSYCSYWVIIIYPFSFLPS